MTLKTVKENIGNISHPIFFLLAICFLIYLYFWGGGPSKQDVQLEMQKLQTHVNTEVQEIYNRGYSDGKKGKDPVMVRLKLNIVVE